LETYSGKNYCSVCCYDFFSSSVFAASISLDGFRKNTSFADVESFFEDNDLFATVEAVALTESEAAEIEGEGLLGAVIGGIVGGVGFTCKFIGEVLNNPPKTSTEIAQIVVSGTLFIGLATIIGIGSGSILPF
jgi:hypothetical protein